MMYKFKELLGDAFPIIEQYAPRVAQALGGPMAGTAISALILLAEHFNVDITKGHADIEKIRDTILNEPAKSTILENLANNFGSEMLEILRQHFPKEIDSDIDVKF